MTTSSDPNPSTALVVLAGGRSTRMGKDKLDLVLGGSTLLERTLHLARKLNRPVLLADGTTRQPGGTQLQGSGALDPGGSIERCADGPGRGPAAGLLGAAAIRPQSALLAVASDLPFLSLDLLRAILQYATTTCADVVIPLDNQRLHPLTAYYSPRALQRLLQRVTSPATEGPLNRQRCGLARFAKDLLRNGHDQQPEALASRSSPPPTVELVQAKDLGLTDQQLEQSLFNCNSPGDWRRAQQLLAASTDR